MSYSQNLSLGEIAYYGFNSILEEGQFLPWDQLREAEQIRWAQAARNACDAMIAGIDPAKWYQISRDAFAQEREKRKKDPAYGILHLREPR